MSCSVCALPRHCAQQFQKKGKAERTAMEWEEERRKMGLHLNHPHSLGPGRGLAQVMSDLGGSLESRFSKGVFFEV